MVGIKLVVDDDQLLSSLVAEMLDIQNTKNLTTIAEAKVFLETQDVGLILCDLNMPNGGAQNLYEHLVQQNHPARTKMIVMTGGAVDPLAQQFLNQTQMPVLYKPFAHSDFIKAIGELEALYAPHTSS